MNYLEKRLINYMPYMEKFGIINDIRIAQKLFPKKHESTFDLVLGVEVIEHVENPWEYIRTLKTLVKNGGYLLISTPNITSWLSRIIFLLTGRFYQFNEYDLNYGHIAPITSFHLEVILKHEKLEEIVTRPAGTLPPFWLLANPYIIKLNIFNLIFYRFMQGIKKGWCIITIAKKP